MIRAALKGLIVFSSRTVVTEALASAAKETDMRDASRTNVPNCRHPPLAARGGRRPAAEGRTCGF